MVRPLNPQEWSELMIRAYHEGQAGNQDCVGNPIQWHPTDTECDVHEDEDEPAPTAVPLTHDSVIVGRTDRSTRNVVWIVTHHFRNGDGFGPVAVADRSARGVAIRALGSLRLPLERARLRLRETGGQEVLVADGERCPEPDDDASDQPQNLETEDGQAPQDETPVCYRVAQLMPLVRDRLLSPEIRNAAATGEDDSDAGPPQSTSARARREQEDNSAETSTSACLGPARVTLTEERTVGLENGWERKFTLAASLEYRGGTVIAHEQVIVEDSDPQDPGRPSRLFRTTDADRVIFLRRGGMVSRGLPLLERTVRAHGSIQLPISESEEESEDSEDAQSGVAGSGHNGRQSGDRGGRGRR